MTTSRTVRPGRPKAHTQPTADAALYRALVENAPDSLFVFDTAASIELAIRHDPWLSEECFHDDGTSDHADTGSRVLRTAVARVAATGRDETHEFPASGPHGTQRWYSGHFKRHEEVGGERKVLLFVRDITERHEAETELRTTVRALEESKREILQALGQMLKAAEEPSVRTSQLPASTDTRPVESAVIVPATEPSSGEPEPLPRTDSRTSPARRFDGLALVVEDNSAIRQIMTRSLQSMGLHVLEACTAEEAVSTVRDLDARVDLLVTDVTLPGRNGLELASELRARQPDLRVLVCSGYLGEEREAEIPIDGRTTFLPKPFTGRQLSSEASRLLV